MQQVLRESHVCHQQTQTQAKHSIMFDTGPDADCCALLFLHRFTNAEAKSVKFCLISNITRRTAQQPIDCSYIKPVDLQTST